MTSTLEAPAPPTCDLCSQPVELTEDRVAVLLCNIDRGDAIDVVVEDAVVLSIQHRDCTRPVVACAPCGEGFGTYQALSLHRCERMAA